MTEQEKKKILLHAQQGELDASIVYQRLADQVYDEEVAERLRHIGREEARHAVIFYKMTGEKLQAVDKQAKAACMLYRIIGAKLMYKFLAIKEMNAAYRYASIIDDFPKVIQIRLDEENHSRILDELSKKVGYRC